MRKRRGIIRRNFSKVGLLCLALVLGMGSLTIGYAAWTDTVNISGTVTTGSWEVGGGFDGTNGFWKNWASHNTYTQIEIDGWLTQIDTDSAWFGPTTVGGMEALFADAIVGGATMEDKFLAHYLATRLNVASGRLFPGTTHDVTGISEYVYLGLAIPPSATLTDIIIAIEAIGTLPTPPTPAEFEIMKNICDALNNLNI